jgi:hypothetical protein
MKREVVPGSKLCSRSALICLAVIFAVSGWGCAGSRGWIKFDELRYPASMSPYLYGPNNELLAKDRELRVIDSFSGEHHYWGVVYSLVPLSGTKEIGEQINRAIERAGGDGIVNVKVTSASNFMSEAFILNILPVWPSQTKVVVEGEIVKYEPGAKYGQLRAEEVLIIADLDDTVTNQLSKRCRAMGLGETLFAGSTPMSCAEPGADYWKQLWKTMSPADTDGHFPHMLNSVKMKAQVKGANVVQIVHLTYDHDEILEKHKETPLAPPVADYYHSVALDVRYWSCPTQTTK